jgi:translation initiation factor 2 beta subunit (eIF-2beta)/eIF-5
MQERKDSGFVISENDISLIQKSIKEKILNKNVVPRSVFYDLLKDKLESKIDKTAFCQVISQLIASNIISGYEIRRGRTGGIHLKGLFSGHDAKRIEKTKIKTEKKQKTTTSIKIDDINYLVKTSPEEVLRFFTHILNAEADTDGNVFLSGMCFRVKEIDILKNYVLLYCNGSVVT